MNDRAISKTDEEHLRIIRRNVSAFLKRCAERYDRAGMLLDIAPQVHEGARPYFRLAEVRTLDIDPASNTDYIADICCRNHNICGDDAFDFVVCTEVLEHTLDPFGAVREIYRLLKPGGLLFLSVPFNLRIHGPLPDCWRFTEHGIRELLKAFRLIELSEVETEDRWLMPIHYTVIAQKQEDGGDS